MAAARGDKPERSATLTRKREILDAALACFSSKGYDATTLADIRKRAQASTGSIYHHFVNKGDLAAALYLEGVRATQEHTLRELVTQRTLENGIKSVVCSSLDWIQENPLFARFLFSMRHADFMEPVEAELERMNRAALATASAWFRDHAGNVKLSGVAPDVVRAILYGPAMHYARDLLRKDPTVDITRDKQQLAAAAYAALKPLLLAPATRKDPSEGPAKPRRKVAMRRRGSSG